MKISIRPDNIPIGKFFPQPPIINTRQEIFQFTKEILRKYALKPKKSLGQHFMVDPNILYTYARTLSPYSFKNIVEIGPGPGTLTKLLRQGKFDNLTVIEKDPNFSIILEQSYPDITVKNTDVLFMQSEFWQSKNCVVGNIPFEISSPLIYKLTKSRFFSKGNQVLILVQKEFALKMTGNAGTQNYGKLSVNVQLCTNPKIIAHFGPGSFYPPPKVASILILLESKEEINPLVFESEFQTFLSIIFTRKNRTIRSMLINYAKHKKYMSNIEKVVNSDPFTAKRVKDIPPLGILGLYKRIKPFLFYKEI
ncbi:MAG: 16S rRNA (adenine(1518)-N(6)/adenine(1519)-N(6))-dimethyltransferase RsmA [Candidatus Thorarchaeota archaeon]